jgi:hypothetical protein
MTSERLMAALDEAEYVKYDPDGYVLAWFGGESGIHVYDAAGRETGFWQIADGLTLSKVRESMVGHMTSGEPYPS